MKKTGFAILISLFTMAGLLIQVKVSGQQKGKQQAVAFGINVPLGEFAKTHIAGIGSHYTWSNHRFGKLVVLPKKWIGFTANGGIDYYLGKKAEVAGYDFKYGGYICLHALGGIMYNPGKKTNVTLTTGPVMNIYKGGADAGLGVLFNGSLYITDKIAVTPGIMYTKYAEANALWAASIKATYIF